MIECLPTEALLQLMKVLVVVKRRLDGMMSYTDKIGIKLPLLVVIKINAMSSVEKS